VGVNGFFKLSDCIFFNYPSAPGELRPWQDGVDLLCKALFFNIKILSYLLGVFWLEALLHQFELV
jgi:hypothetical protein